MMVDATPISRPPRFLTTEGRRRKGPPRWWPLVLAGAVYCSHDDATVRGSVRLSSQRTTGGGRRVSTVVKGTVNTGCSLGSGKPSPSASELGR
jgi:hypothetical protein